MKISSKNLKTGIVKVVVENLDDLWHLSHIIEKGDVVRGKATRKIKASEKETVKKTITLSIHVQEADFKDKSLRLNGITIDEMEEIPKGSYQAISLDENSPLTITKKKWTVYALKRLESSAKKKTTSLIMILDREEAIFAILKDQGYETLAHLKGKVAKKGFETITTNFYKELSLKLEEYDVRFSPDGIIVASPAFWREEFMNNFSNQEVKRKIFMAGCSSVTGNAIEEIMKRPELKESLKQHRTAEESLLVECLMERISKNGLAIYGEKQVFEMVVRGNGKQLLITDKFIISERKKAEELMKTTENLKGEVTIVNSENEPGKKLDALGGIGLLLRYAVY